MGLRDTSTLPINILIRGGQQYKAAKNEVSRLAASFASGGNANEVLGSVRFLQQVLPALKAVVDNPDMVQLAKDAYGDQGYDIAVEMGVLVDAIEIAIVDIVGLFPKQGNFILTHSFNASNDLVPRNFTGAQLAPLITKLNDISAAVE